MKHYHKPTTTRVILQSQGIICLSTNEDYGSIQLAPGRQSKEKI